MSRFPFEKVGFNICLAGVVLQDTDTKNEYICYLPGNEPADEAEVYQDWTPKEWDSVILFLYLVMEHYRREGVTQ